MKLSRRRFLHLAAGIAALPMGPQLACARGYPARKVRVIVPFPAGVDKLNLEINTCLADPKTKTRFAELGAAVLPGSRADFGKLIASETEKWGKVIRAAHIKPE